MIEIHLGPRLLPALLVGWRVPWGIPPGFWPAAPSWIVTTEHRTGGAIVRERTNTLSLLLPLARNRRAFRGDPDALFAAFAAIAPGVPAERVSGSPLDVVAHRAGEPFGARQLGTLAAFLDPFLRLPAPVEGVESFVRLADADPASYLDGWTAIDGGERGGLAGDAEVHGEVRADGDVFGRLTAFGREEPTLSGPPRIHLAWYGAD